MAKLHLSTAQNWTVEREQEEPLADGKDASAHGGPQDRGRMARPNRGGDFVIDMAVSLWAVLGIVLLLIGLPLVLLPNSFRQDFAYLVGAGVAFLIVAVSQLIWDYWSSTSESETERTNA